MAKLNIEAVGGFAFPVPAETYGLNGMTLRDWFAGMVLIGLVERRAGPISVVAEVAYEVADAMLKERNKEKTHE